MYFEWTKKSFETQADGAHFPVVIVGAGPVGLAMALNLSNSGIRCVVLESRDQVSDGSRAIALTRRTMQIFDALGIGSKVLAKAVTWDLNAVHFGDQLVYEMRLMQPSNEKHRMTNLQQCWVEQLFLDELEEDGHADVRWCCAVVNVTQSAAAVEVTVQSAEGLRYQLSADYVVAADGARGSTRKLLGLHYEGRRYEQQFVITDFHMKSKTEIGRRVWFSPPYAPGTTVLQHSGPFDVWRLDYQLRPTDDPDEEVKPERVAARLDAHLRMIGETAPHEIIWTSIYRASALSLPDYQKGRVVFVGDAAHQIPIFGGRGINNGFMDVFNLAWKLAYVVQGIASPDLLATYTEERRTAMLATIEDLSKITIYMTTPASAVALMRDAVLSLSLTESFVHTLFDPFRVPPYASLEFGVSPAARRSDHEFESGPAIGRVAPDVQVSTSQGRSWLLTEIDGGFACLFWDNDGEVVSDLQEFITHVNRADLPLRCFAMNTTRSYAGATPLYCRASLELFAATPGTAYVLRPDHHVLGRWKRPIPEEVVGVVREALKMPKQERAVEVSQ